MPFLGTKLNQLPLFKDNIDVLLGDYYYRRYSLVGEGDVLTAVCLCAREQNNRKILKWIFVKFGECVGHRQEKS